MQNDPRRYVVHHRGSRFRGRKVRLLNRPQGKGIKNVLAECVDTGERFVCPFRGLWKVREDSNG